MTTAMMKIIGGMTTLMNLSKSGKIVTLIRWRCFHQIYCTGDLVLCYISQSMSQSNIFSCKSATVHTPISASEFVCGHNSVSTGARKLKYGMKDACSRIGTFSHFLKIPLFYPEIGKTCLQPYLHIGQGQEVEIWYEGFLLPYLGVFFFIF